MTPRATFPMRDRTLRAEHYTEASTYEMERDAVFARAWQLAGYSSDVAVPGAYTTALLGDREFVTVRDTDGTLRAFHNVCAHRGAAVAKGCGQRMTLQCPYHGWTYRLDGELHRAPGMAGLDEGVSLRQVRVVERAPFIFVSPDDNPPDFDGQFETLFAYLGQELPLGEIAKGSRRVTRTFTMAANWKVVMENSLECYHCGIAHPGLANSLDLDRYEHRLSPWWSVQGAPMRDSKRPSETSLGASSRSAARGDDGFEFSRFIFLYPNLFLEIYPGSASFATLLVLPESVDRTRSVHVKFLPTEVSDAEEEEWNAFVEQVIQEDIALCESVQRGLRSGAMDQGLLNIRGDGANEECIGHFDALVANAHARASA